MVNKALVINEAIPSSHYGFVTLISLYSLLRYAIFHFHCAYAHRATFFSSIISFFFELLLHFVIGIILPIIALCAVGEASMLYLQQQQQQQRETMQFSWCGTECYAKKTHEGERKTKLELQAQTLAKLSTIHAV